MGIKLNIDSVPIGTGTTTGIGVVNATQLVPIRINCDPACAGLIQDEVVCDVTDMWNCNVCSNDSKYYHPVVGGDCLHFQFQFQNTRNASNSISFQQWTQRPNPKIQFGWFHYTRQPLNWTVRAKLINACNDAEFIISTPSPHNYADDIMQSAVVFLDQDNNASSKTLPLNSWYKWIQNARFCLPATLPAGFPTQFYFEFEVLPFGWSSGAGRKAYSQVYEIEKCNDTFLLEGVYSRNDCFGYTYSEPITQPIATPPDFTPAKVGITPLLQVLPNPNSIGAFTATGTKLSGAYSNIHRFRGTAQYVEREIEKEIPERQCFSIKTKVREIYRVRTNREVPPYIAEIYNNNISGRVALLSGVPNKATIEVQPVGGAQKNDDINNMWGIDTRFRGCECLDFHQC